MNDGPLIVQSDKTLLLEIDHERAADCRKAIAPFAELERSPEHVHTYRLTPLGSVERPRRRPRRRAGRRHAAGVQPLRRPARAARRRRRDDGALRPAAAGEAPDPRAGAGQHRPARCSRRCCAPRRSPGCSAPASTTTPWSCTPPSAATSSRRCSSWAGRPRTSPATSTARRTRSRSTRTDWTLRDYQREAAESFWHGGSGRRRAPLRRRQDAGRRGRDGARPGDHADPGHQHRQRAAVEGRAAPAHVADRGRDRRVLRLGQGDPAGHHRDVPGDDDQAEGRLPPPRAARRPRLGPDRLRRGAPAAGADLPDDRGPAGPPPDRADRDAGARGRPRGRRVLADRAEAVRRAVEGHRGPGLDRAGRLRRGPGHAADGERLAYATAEPEERYRLASCTHAEDPGRPRPRRLARRASRRW